MLGEQLLHHRIAHLRPPILVHHALVVMRLRAVHRPFLRHAAIRELPQEHAAARRVLKHRLHLIAQNCALPLLRPLRFAQRVMVAVNAARADFADDDGLPRPAVLADFLEFLRQALRNGRVVIPLRIDVHAHHVAVAIDAAAGALQERGGHRAGRIQVVQKRIDFAIAVRAVITVVRALGQASPNENGRVIAVLGNHFAHALARLRHEVRVAHLLFGKSPRVRLLPDQQAHFVAEVKEARVIGVVAGAHAVAAHVLHHQDVLRHGLQRHRAAERAVLLVAVEAHQAEFLAVEQNIRAGNADFAEAHAVNQVIQRLISFADFSAEGVERGRIRRPRGHIRIMRIGNADCRRAVCRDVRGLGERLPRKGEGDVRRRVVIRQIADGCGNIRRPAVRRALRRDADALHKRPAAAQ